MYSCMMMALAARMRSPLRAPIDTNESVTTIMQKLLKKMWLFTRIMRVMPSVCITSFNEAPRSILRCLLNISTALYISPMYSATSVPTAMPTKPIFSTNTAIRLATTLSESTQMDMCIALLESCIPRNQPFTAIMMSTAGAPQITM